MKTFYFYSTIAWLLIGFQVACGQVTPDAAKTELNTVVEKSKESKPNLDNETVGNGKIDETYPSLRVQADTYRRVFLAEDFEKYMDFMHPVTIEAAGGREKFAAMLREGRSNLRSHGVEFVSFEIGVPTQKIEMDNKIFVVLPSETKMKNPQTVTTEEGSILAVSEDKGKRWKFISASSKERLRFLFPNLVDKLNFPESRMK